MKKPLYFKIGLGALLAVLLVGVILMVNVFTKSSQQKKAEEFIRMELSCETYKKAKEPQVKEKFMVYMTEEGYKAYLDNFFLYMYPQMFNQVRATETQIKTIECKEVKKNNDGSETLIYEVKYTIKSKDSKMDMRDDLSITMDSKEKISEVILLNTSDIIKKLYLDVKVQ